MGKSRQSRIFDFYPLEDRILLSGEGLDGAEMSVDADPDFAASLLADRTADGEASVDPALAASVDPTSADAIAVPQDVADSPTFDPALPLEVVFVDSAVDDADTLLDGLRVEGDGQTQWLVVELAADQDGIEQITATLTELSSVDAIHIVSHGDGHGIKLGNSWLNGDSASGYAGELAAWAGSLDADADLLIYGCDLASTADGRTLIDSIAALTDADVAASDDDTGHASLGGDWELEYFVGAIEADVAFDVQTQQDWVGLLAPGNSGTAIWGESGPTRPSSTNGMVCPLAPKPTQPTWVSGGSCRVPRHRRATRSSSSALIPAAPSKARCGTAAVGARWRSIRSVRSRRLIGGAWMWPTNPTAATPCWFGPTVPTSNTPPGTGLRGRSVNTIGIYSGATPRQLQLAASPNADEMVLVVSDSNSHDSALCLGWRRWGNAVTLATNSGDDRTDINVAYEQQSGRRDGRLQRQTQATSCATRSGMESSWSGQENLRRSLVLLVATPAGRRSRPIRTAIELLSAS